MEILLILFLVAVFGSGYLLATMQRRRTLKKFQQSTPLTSLYYLTHELTPFEFGALVKGKVTYDAFLGQLVYMQLDNLVMLGNTPKVLLQLTPPLPQHH